MAGKSLQPPRIKNPHVLGLYKIHSVSLYEIMAMKVDKVWDIQNIKTGPAKTQVLGDHISKYTIERPVSGMDNHEHTIF